MDHNALYILLYANNVPYYEGKVRGGRAYNIGL